MPEKVALISVKRISDVKGDVCFEITKNNKEAGTFIFPNNFLVGEQRLIMVISEKDLQE